MTGRWEALTGEQQTTVLLNLRSWLDLGDDPVIRSALNVLCAHEWHGADGGACPGCGWDSHPIPAGDLPPVALPDLPHFPPLVVPYQGGRHTGTPTIDLPA